MDYLYLRIAGFNFRIYFCYHQHEPEATLMVRKFQLQITNAYEGFRIEKISKIDQKIEVHFRLPVIYPTTISIKGSSLIFFEEKENLIITSAHLSLYQFSFLLLTLLQRLLSNNQGFILHTSASVINGRVCLFLAPSGGGKTTVIRLLRRKFTPLANDSVAVRWENKKYFIYQTPLLEDFKPKIKNTVRTYPLGKLFLLEKAQDIKIVSLKKSSGLIKKVFPQIRITNKINKEQLTLFLRFMENNNFFRLYFRKKESELLTFFKSL
ncbi:hypothetical protein A3D78_01440 [Candidatus Gottesmanbacteria bacterium RIFCSPHIGHO2_02_FULL_39_14]|uniref:HPr kinase/phosphorylase C-terminal domain-containing protein n=1 Tax=Candidatus Gottesmanbacteria bacterium RIFCSPHIGHO2_02_FULL_39_14 TaxID=1798383 RepID=A0A1F5ZX60_9BACT|nr:MAG: hypothetical protein A3D78_01440 [Candidatus Gottesmanbacteria bacterium RIFCSPHIGHO2_02_FULL_39_14]